MRIGLYGGSFDPIHNAHLLLAETARECYELDRVLFIPCHDQPLKNEITRARDEDRLEMIALAIKGNPHFEVCDTEIRRGGVSYTMDTVEILKRELGHGHEYFLLLGGDSALEFNKWKRYEELIREVTLLVAPRGKFSPDDYAAEIREYIQPVIMPRMDISASDIRERVGQWGSIRYLVPDLVREYIEEEGLYC